LAQIPHNSEEEIISLILSGGSDYEKASVLLLDQYKGYLKKVNEKLFLPTEVLHDAYADAIIKLLKQVREGKFRGESKMSTYFYAIFYHTAVDVSRKSTSNKIETREVLEHDAKTADLLSLIDSNDEAKLLMGQIAMLEDPCKRILMDWGYYGYSMDEIAERSSLANASSARSMKYKCLKKLKSMLKRN